jgi:hypothetical protein
MAELGGIRITENVDILGLGGFPLQRLVRDGGVASRLSVSSARPSAPPSPLIYVVFSLRLSVVMRQREHFLVNVFYR